MNDFVIEQDPKILQLVAAYPRLFRRKPPRVWSDLPSGWLSIVDQMFRDIDAKLDDAEARQFKVEQIKEKFGCLRVYWKFRQRGYWHPREDPPLPGLHPAYERLFLIIDDAIRRADQTCLRCGAPGSLLIVNGWYATLCPIHGEKSAGAPHDDDD
jgi:hypothetical protein